MPEEPKKWITVNGKHIPLDENGEPMNETGKKTLGKETDKSDEKAEQSSAENAEAKPESQAEKKGELEPETGNTVTKSDGLTYSKTLAQYREAHEGDTYEGAKAFFKNELQGKTVKCQIANGEIVVQFTGGSWREIKRGLKQDPLKAEIIPLMPDIITTGEYSLETLYKDRDDKTKAFHSYRKVVHTSDGDKETIVDVAERPKQIPEYGVYNLTREGSRNYEVRAQHQAKRNASKADPGKSPGEIEAQNDVVKHIIHDEARNEKGQSYFEIVNIRFAGDPIEIEEDEMPRDRPNGDRLVFDVKTSKRHKDSNGYLHVEGSNITKEQIAPYYGREIPGWEGLGLAPHKLYYMYRPAEELEKAAGDFKGMPLLFEHHDTDASNPAKEFLIGSLGTDAEFKAPYVVSSLVITDGEAVAALERGDYKELSAGYHYDPVMTGGVFDGDHYDGYMTNIRPNHVALVKEGRAGPDVAVADQKPQGLEIRAEKPPRRESKDMENNAFKLDLETLTKAVQALLAKCREPGVDEDPVVQEVTDQFFPDAGEEDKKKVMEMLLAIKPEPVKDEPGPEGEENQENEALKKAMADCSIDSDNPEAVKAFAEGMKYAEKLAENHADEEKADKEDKLQELAKELEEQKATMDSRLKSLKEKAIEDTKAHYKALYKAAQDCRPVLGVLADPLTFDSAGDIYRKALVTAGVDIKGVHPSAFPAMLKMVQSQGQKQSFAAPTMATDSKDSNFLQGAAEGLARIQL